MFVALIDRIGSLQVNRMAADMEALQDIERFKSYGTARTNATTEPRTRPQD